jgi:uncharacterized lipoprotein YmbA
MNLPKTSRLGPLLRWASLCVLGVVAGCNVVPPPQDDPTRYYVLSDASAASAQAAGGLRIGLRTVRLEGYLKRHEIVVRTGANEVEFRDYRRWAEPLDAAIARIVRSGLLASPGVSQVWIEPFPLEQDRDFDVSIEVTRCEGAAAASGGYVASLSAMIEVSTSGANAHVVARRIFTAPEGAWDGRNFDRLAALLSGDAAALGRDVVAAIPARN